MFSGEGSGVLSGIAVTLSQTTYCVAFSCLGRNHPSPTGLDWTGQDSSLTSKRRGLRNSKLEENPKAQKHLPCSSVSGTHKQSTWE